MNKSFIQRWNHAMGSFLMILVLMLPQLSTVIQFWSVPIAYAALDAPDYLGNNVRSLGSGLGDTPVDIPCDPANPLIGDPNEWYSSVWTEVSGNNVKYIRYNIRPDGSYLLLGGNARLEVADNPSDLSFNDLANIEALGGSYPDSHSNNWGTYGAGEGTYTTHVLAFEDENNNGVYNSDEAHSSWSNSCSSTYDLTSPDVQWNNPVDGDMAGGSVKLEATCDGGDTQSKYVNFWWWKDGQEQKVKVDNDATNGNDDAFENHQYHYVYRDNPNGGSVNGNVFSWTLDTTDDSLKSGTYDWYGDWKFRAACKDEAGNYSSASIEVTIISQPGIPTQTGYNEKDGTGDSYSTPRNPNELSCTGEFTNVNNVSVHWTEVSTGDITLDDMLRYQRNYNVNGGSWYGYEEYEEPYTNFRSFGGGNGTDGTYGSRVRAFYDIDGNGTYTQGEPVSDWSNECFITYDNTVPEAPTDWKTRFTHNNDTTSSKYKFTFTESASDDIDRYEYQFNSYDLETGDHYSGKTNINAQGCDITDFNTEETCTWTVTAQQKRAWIYRVRAVDQAGNTSEWTNWDNIPWNDGDPSTMDFNEVAMSDMEYEDWKNGTGIFNNSTYDYNDGGFIVREDMSPDTEITSPDTSVVHYVNAPIAIDYETINEDWTEVKKVELWYSYEGSNYQLDSENYTPNGSINFNFTEGNGTYCFYTVGEDIADDGQQDNNQGNRELAPTPECELEVVYDESVPTIDEIEDKVYKEGEVINLGFLDGLAMRDENGNLDKLHITATYTTPQGDSYTASDTLDVSMAGCPSGGLTFDGCGKGGTTNQLVEYITGSTVNFTDYNIPIDTSVIPEGEYILEYYVTDTTGNKSTVHEVVITIENVAPIVSLSKDQTVEEGDIVNFEGSFVDPSTVEIDDSIYVDGNWYDDGDWSVSVDYGEGNGYESLSDMSDSGDVTGLSNKYEKAGTYTVSLKVCESSGNTNIWGLEDGEGECTIASVEVVVVNVVPEVEITPASSTVETGDTVTLTTSVSSGNTPYKYSWSCSNGDTYGDVESIDFSEETAGTYTCSVTVTDTDGDKDTASADIEVEEPEVVEFYGTGAGVVAEGFEEEVEEETTEEETTEGEGETEEGEILGAEEEQCEVKSKLSGYTYEDKNKNGEKDEGEEAIAEVEVMIYEGKEIEEGQEAILKVNTDENGYWEAETCPGDYIVKINEETAPGKYEVPEAQVLGVSEEGNEDVNFGFVKNKSILSYWWVLLILVVLVALAAILLTRKEKAEIVNN